MITTYFFILYIYSILPNIPYICIIAVIYTNNNYPSKQR